MAVLLGEATIKLTGEPVELMKELSTLRDLILHRYPHDLLLVECAQRTTNSAREMIDKLASPDPTPGLIVGPATERVTSYAGSAASLKHAPGVEVARKSAKTIYTTKN